jgi:hypothetical protein
VLQRLPCPAAHHVHIRVALPLSTATATAASDCVRLERNARRSSCIASSPLVSRPRQGSRPSDVRPAAGELQCWKRCGRGGDEQPHSKRPTCWPWTRRKKHAAVKPAQPAGPSAVLRCPSCCMQPAASSPDETCSLFFRCLEIAARQIPVDDSLMLCPEEVITHCQNVPRPFPCVANPEVQGDDSQGAR